MGNKVKPDDITQIDNSSGVATVNDNFDLTADEFDKVLYRDGSQTVTGDIDMDSNRIINLRDAVLQGEPITLGQANIYADAVAALYNFWPSKAEGEANTKPGDFFSYPDGLGHIFYAVRDLVGSSVFAEAATAADIATRVPYTELASTAPSGGAELVGLDDGSSGALWTTVAGFQNYLKSTAGPTEVGFINTGVGAVVSNLMDELRRGVIWAEQFGAGDGSPDDSPAIQLAINEAAASGRVLKFGKASYVCNTDIEVVGENIVMRGLADRGTQFLFASDAQFRTEVGATFNDYKVKRLTLVDLMFYVKDATARTKPTVSLTHALYTTAKNCTFYGDTPKTRAALLLQSSLTNNFYSCNFWGGSYGVYGGDTGTNSPNDTNFWGCNFNGSTRAIDGVFFVCNILGGACQSVGDGFRFSGNVAQASSSINVKGVYFEAVTNRCVDAGEGGYVYNLNVSGNYFASLASGTVAPVLIQRVVGYDIGPNHWGGYDASVTGMVEVVHATAAPSGTTLYFPRKGRIQKNVTPYTDERGQFFFTAGMSDDNKGNLAGANDGFGSGRKKTRVTIPITTTGNLDAVLLDAARNRYIHSATLITDKGFDIAANLTVGVAVSPTFQVSSTPLTTKAANNITALTINNAFTRPANGAVFARIAATVVTVPGQVQIELEYSEIE